MAAISQVRKARLREAKTTARDGSRPWCFAQSSPPGAFLGGRNASPETWLLRAAFDSTARNHWQMEMASKPGLRPARDRARSGIRAPCSAREVRGDGPFSRRRQSQRPGHQGWQKRLLFWGAMVRGRAGFLEPNHTPPSLRRLQGAKKPRLSPPMTTVSMGSSHSVWGPVRGTWNALLLLILPALFWIVTSFAVN